ncbi:enoyl-CoA hydratase/isomerase family protein [Rhodococcus sp. NPDC056743]|uniref:enoyl-CoA hydratase/isomerase family protein n=1 Tax=Rhodococcus sp. NPDC056743 TaxID=3345934 RepID=UPI00366A9839
MSERISAQPIDDGVDVDIHDSGVAVVTFTRGRNNYFDYDLIDTLATRLEELPAAGARAVVLRTTSRHFCAGADFVGREDEQAGRHVYDIVPRLFAQTLPIVAAVGGAAIGGGLGLALVADFRITTPSAYFLANFNRIGVSEGFALSVTLRRLVGPQKASEMLYASSRVGGQAAVMAGLSDRMVDDAELDDAALAFATEIALSAPLAVAASRRALRSDVTSDIIAEALRRERAEQKPLMTTSDFHEGVQAWRDKRTPAFQRL